MASPFQYFSEYLNFFLLFSSLLGFLYAIGEFFSYHKNRKQILLGIIFLGTSYLLFNFYLISSGKINGLYPLFLTDLPIVACLGVLLDEYFLMILEGKFRSFRRLSYRIVPLTSLFVLIVLWNIWNKTDYLEIQALGLNPFLSRPLFLVLPTILIYIWCLLRIFRRISKQIRWSTFRKNYTLRIGILIVGFCLALSIHGLVTLARGGQTAHQLSGIAIGFFLCFLYVLRQTYPDFFLEVRKIVEDEKKAKISQISKLDHKEVRNKLQDLFEKEKIYREEKLSLRELAERVDLSSHQLSEFLNTEIKQSFYQYTNFYRVSEAKEKIEKEPDRSLLAIAYDVGFGSKSTFNEAFKKETGTTPREYREKILKKHPVRSSRS
ncbi:AraC family transcriptional regulator [Leptospira bourretii]|uniref:AraC family transcriptional regulator n=1 Tax=Leptospira bourretii TaxID=2484962 RepID=A0A4R9IJJ1_9LEPT|nr:helix-turn-helix domain-containing protein [Leptospira bourretii]TGK88175.1 AraC family transcriptional regulator [Leptospira bourretii]TGK88825.1 AraC family transcriptional regulator [Leptospira bourretii]TGL27432.1 AraC family transcriptional regulator [Leptospira bourretii]